MIIGEKIKLLRTEKKLTQSELAKELNVSSQAVSNWERHKGYPDISNIIQVSDLFDISLDELIKDDNDFKERLMSSKFENGLDVLKNVLFLVLGSLGVVDQMYQLLSGGFQEISIFVLLVAIFMLADSIVFFFQRSKTTQNQQIEKL